MLVPVLVLVLVPVLVLVLALALALVLVLVGYKPLVVAPVTAGRLLLEYSDYENSFSLTTPPEK